MLKIGELSKRSGLTKRTIDYYTKLGLLDIAETAENGYRRYSDVCLQTIELIEYYKVKHLTLEEIKCKLDIMSKINEKEIKRKLENLCLMLEEAETEISELKVLTNDPEQIKSLLHDIGLKNHPLSRSIVTLLG